MFSGHSLACAARAAGSSGVPSGRPGLARSGVQSKNGFRFVLDLVGIDEWGDKIGTLGPGDLLGILRAIKMQN